MSRQRHLRALTTRNRRAVAAAADDEAAHTALPLPRHEYVAVSRLQPSHGALSRQVTVGTASGSAVLAMVQAQVAERKAAQEKRDREAEVAAEAEREAKAKLEREAKEAKEREEAEAVIARSSSEEQSRSQSSSGSPDEKLIEVRRGSSCHC